MSDLAKLGDLIFSVVTEEVIKFENKTTDHPIEDGSVITDHVQTNPLIIQISGNIVGDDAAEKSELLVQYFNKKTLNTYVGRGLVGNCIVEEFSRDVDSAIANGFNFSMTLKQIKFVRKIEINIDTTKLIIPQIKEKTKKVEKLRKILEL